MNSVESVKSICRERKLPIYKLEKDLGFSNGYIGQLRKGVLPDDRLALIAEYLSVSVEYLMTGTEKAPTPEGERSVSDGDLKAAFYNGYDDLSPEEIDELWEDALEYARFKAEQRRKKK